MAPSTIQQNIFQAHLEIPTEQNATFAQGQNNPELCNRLVETSSPLIPGWGRGHAPAPLSHPKTPPALTRQTDIWLVVRVPVLSEQMTEVQPRVSTEGRLRTMAFFLAMRRVPSARHVVITAGRPSGMAATARATEVLK